MTTPAPPHSSPRRPSDRVVPLPPTAGQRVGAYEVLRELGRGGMGAVYHVRHVETDVDYALKVILPELAVYADPEDVARFRREAETLARIPAHPGIVAVRSFGEERGMLFSVMDLVEGDDLRAVAGARPMDPARAARIVAQAGAALAHVHEHGIVHRDLKPENIVVERGTGQVRVLDFGLAADLARTRLTATGEVLGTPSFMAPEQIDATLSGGDVGPRTDVWGLGAVLYALLTAMPPFAGRDPIAVMAAVLDEHPAPPRRVAPSVPAALETICLRALEKRPGARYASAADLAADLERWLAGLTPAVESRSSIQRIWRAIVPAGRRSRRNRVAIAIVAALALLIAAAGGGILLQALRDRRRIAEARVAESNRVGEELADAWRAVEEGADLQSLLVAAERVRELGRDRAVEVIGEAGVRRIEALAGLARGGRVGLHLVGSEADATLATRVAVRSRNEPALAAQLGRTLDTNLAEAIVDVLIEDAAIEGPIAVAVLDRLRQLAPVSETGRRDRLRARLLARRVAAHLDDPAPAEKLVASADELAAIVGKTDEPPELRPDEARRLVELVLSPVDEEVLAATFELALWFPKTTSRLEDGSLSPDDERRMIFDKAKEIMFLSRVPDASLSEPGLRFGVGLVRIGAWLYWAGDLAHMTSSQDAIVRRFEALRGEVGRVDSRELVDPGELALYLAGFIATRSAEHLEGQLRSDPLAGLAEARALDEGWWAVRALLDREASRGDLPSWVLGILVRNLMVSGLPTAPPEASLDPKLFARLQDRLAARREDGEVLAFIADLAERARARDRKRRSDRRSFQVVIDLFRIRLAQGRAAIADAELDELEESVERFRELNRDLGLTGPGSQRSTFGSIIRGLGRHALGSTVPDRDADRAYARLREVAKRLDPESPLSDELEAYRRLRRGELEASIRALENTAGKVDLDGRGPSWETFSGVAWHLHAVVLDQTRARRVIDLAPHIPAPRRKAILMAIEERERKTGRRED